MSERNEKKRKGRGERCWVCDGLWVMTRLGRSRWSILPCYRATGTRLLLLLVTPIDGSGWWGGWRSILHKRIKYRLRYEAIQAIGQWHRSPSSVDLNWLTQLAWCYDVTFSESQVVWYLRTHVSLAAFASFNRVWGLKGQVQPKIKTTNHQNALGLDMQGSTDPAIYDCFPLVIALELKLSRRDYRCGGGSPIWLKAMDEWEPSQDEISL